MRRLSSGTLIFPHRGNPPQDRAGYTRDPGDAFVFFPILVDCTNRERRQDKRGCCNSQYLYCTALGRRIVPATCEMCKASLEWVAEQRSKYG